MLKPITDEAQREVLQLAAEIIEALRMGKKFRGVGMPEQAIPHFRKGMALARELARQLSEREGVEIPEPDPAALGGAPTPAANEPPKENQKK